MFWFSPSALRDAAISIHRAPISSRIDWAPVSSRIHWAPISSRIHWAPVSSRIHWAPISSRIHWAPVSSRIHWALLSTGCWSAYTSGCGPVADSWLETESFPPEANEKGERWCIVGKRRWRQESAVKTLTTPNVRRLFLHVFVDLPSCNKKHSVEPLPHTVNPVSYRIYWNPPPACAESPDRCSSVPVTASTRLSSIRRTRLSPSAGSKGADINPAKPQSTRGTLSRCSWCINRQRRA